MFLVKYIQDMFNTAKCEILKIKKNTASLFSNKIPLISCSKPRNPAFAFNLRNKVAKKVLKTVTNKNAFQ